MFKAKHGDISKRRPTLRGGGSAISIVLPTYNERENIKKVIERIEKFMKQKCEIIVIDDNSSDGTADVAESLSQKYDNIKVIRRPRRLGLSSAVVDGINAANNKMIAVTNPDMQYSLELLPKMVKIMENENAQLVVASRYVPGGKIVGWSPLKRLVSRLAIGFSHFLLPQTRKVMDVESNFMLLKGKPKGVKFEKVTHSRFLIELLAKKPGLKVVEMPCTFTHRGKSKSKLGISYLLSHALFCLKLSKYRPVKFVAVGLSGVAILEVLLYLLVARGVPLFIASALAIEASILNNFIWNDIWTFKERRIKGIVSRCLKFHGVVALGTLTIYITSLVLSYFFGVHYLLATFIGVFPGFIVNYLFSEEIVWKYEGTNFKS
ncbi:MAG: glycosyltransferase [Candidatus Hadarchaeales archaeon]